MSREFHPYPLPDGTLLQAGIPTVPLDHVSYRAAGLGLVRGVVVATYVMDTVGHPAENLENQPIAIYCDVLTYQDRSGQRWGFLPRALVLQDRGSMHSGRIWKPRAATMDITGSELDIEKATNPASMDGDHVLCGFLDNNPNMPVILGGVPHPSRDTGNESKEAGHRMRLKLADGDPDFWKHKGAFYGIDKDGNFVVDTTEAFSTDNLESNGVEPAPAEDGGTGNYNVKLPVGSKLHVEIDGTTNTFEFTETMVDVKLGTGGGATFNITDSAVDVDLGGGLGATLNLSGTALDVKLGGGATFKAELRDALAKFTLGDGSMHVAIAETLKLWLETILKPWLINHIHPTGVGPSGPPDPSTPSSYPPYNDLITSTKLAIPNL